MSQAKVLPIVAKDEWLQPVSEKMEQRHNAYLSRLKEIEQNSSSIVDYANGYQFFGLQFSAEEGGWYFREWLPGAQDVYIFGDFNNWQRTELPLKRNKDGVWSIFLPLEKYKNRIVDGSLYKIVVHGENGWHERLSAYTTLTYEEPTNHNFSTRIYQKEQPFNWRGDNFDPATIGAPLIYEAHIGMSSEEERINSYRKFTKEIIPRCKRLGYNAIQLMAVAEHPYYGSFGYHVSNYFAPSSRFGAPEDLKELVLAAHNQGIAVIMDIVHAHYSKNFNEGLNQLDGTNSHYSLPGEQGEQRYWDSMTFDYGKSQVEHFLLSNLKYWIEEFHFDGFRFDGVTSMLYHHHGYTDFGSHDSFFGDGVNLGAIKYLTLANKLIHTLKPGAISIAEDVSGMPGLCAPIEDGGVGFDYRLAMSTPDYWIEMLEDIPDEDWQMAEIWRRLSERLPGTKTIAYAESHDQALVGDKTIAFRLIDKDMYFNMHKEHSTPVVDRGLALHKMIRLITISVTAQGYLNFMGNEFGHPEWIDFPREGNGYSFAYARRQWSLSKDENLHYIDLERFDQAMVKMAKEHNLFRDDYAFAHSLDQPTQTMVYTHSDLTFVFNWHPTHSIPSYPIPVPEPGTYTIVLNSDEKEFGGFGRIEPGQLFFSETGRDGRHYIKIYNINRAALVFKKS